MVVRWKDKLKLYVITDARFADEIRGTELALEGGATAIQLRMKNATTRRMVEVGEKIRKLTDEYDALFIVNDRVDVALATGADGVHLGREDMPVEVAREIVGDMIIGASASTVEEAIGAEKMGADYIGAGSVFPTKTKENARYIGLDGLSKIVKSVNVPVVAIGGITIENLHRVLDRGVQGVAIVSAIMGAENIERAAREFRKVIDERI